MPIYLELRDVTDDIEDFHRERHPQGYRLSSFSGHANEGNCQCNHEVSVSLESEIRHESIEEETQGSPPRGPCWHSDRKSEGSVLMHPNQIITFK